jgi:ComF family protein
MALRRALSHPATAGIGSGARKIGAAGLGLLYPKRCAGCGGFGVYLCEPCRAGLIAANADRRRCPNCSARWERELNCPRCFAWRALGGVRAPFEMEGTARSLVHAFKYHRVRALAPLMAGLMPAAERLPACDLAFAVPLHRRRQRERGFNQADLLLEQLGLPRGGGVLWRRRRTRQQVGLRGGERQANVAGAMVYEGPPLDGLRVVVVDDVVTTGATMDECARILREHGAAEVLGVSFARSSYDLARGPEHARA